MHLVRFVLVLGFGCAFELAAAAPASLDALLAPILARANLPALAAAVVRSNTIVAAGAVGVRKHGAPNRVTLDDKFHLGSCTKSMTATLAATFVDEGRLAWTNTLAQLLTNVPELHPDYAPVTFAQLLSHRAGLPGDLLSTPHWEHVWDRSHLPPTAQRLALARDLLREKPAVPPGSQFLYANSGYTIAGLILEQRAGEPWEQLLTERVLRPLGMESAGFGAPGSAKPIDQPWGHVLRDGNLVPIAPGPKADNPAAIGPGGTVHCSVLDFARYAMFHLGHNPAARGLKLKPETFARLHTPLPGQEYAFGWIVVPRPWAKGRAYTHMGSNTMNTAVVWIAPGADFAVVIMTNLGGKEAEKACNDVAGKLILEFLK